MTRRPRVLVVGLSHHTAPVGVRERFVFPPRAAAAALNELVGRGPAREAVLLSTCNRTEVYLVAGSRPERNAAAEPAAAEPLDDVLAVLAGRAGMTVEEVREYVYVHRGGDAARHLFRVVASLDSMVVGEAQIQGQVKAAYRAAAELRVGGEGASDARGTPGAARGSGASGTPGTRRGSDADGDVDADADAGTSASAGARSVVGPVLARMFETALAVGSRVRTETELGVGAASVPSAAVELAKKIFGRLEGRSALVLGAGKMSELAVDCFATEGIRSVIVANRTESKARALAERAGGDAIGWDALAERLVDADIVISATAAPRPVLTRERVERALAAGRRGPLLVVDIALPRDVEPAVGELDNVFLYDIDDLQQIVEGNLEKRRGEVPAAERIIADAADEFVGWYRARQVVPLIRALRGRAENVRRSEVEKALRGLRGLGPAEREAVEAMTRQLLNKVLHDPTVRLREAANNGRGASVVEAARYLFALDAAPDADAEDGEA